MEYTHLGGSGLIVSRLCLGTMNFGPQTTETDSHAILDAALELGINVVDTANQYGQRLGEGVTESIIGRWMAKGGARRDKVVLATKVYDRMGDWPNEGKLSARHIRLACEASLRRLQTDYIDLYQMHHIDRDTPMGRDLAGVRHSAAAGKDRLRRVQQLRRLAPRSSSGVRAPARPGRIGERAVDLQPGDPPDRARGASRGAQLWHRRHRVESAARRACSPVCWAGRARAVVAPAARPRSSGTGRHCRRTRIFAVG